MELPAALPGGVVLTICWGRAFGLGPLLASFSLEGSWIKGQASADRQPGMSYHKRAEATKILGAECNNVTEAETEGGFNHKARARTRSGRVRRMDGITIFGGIEFAVVHFVLGRCR